MDNSINKIVIYHNPYAGYKFNMIINYNGAIKYKSTYQEVEALVVISKDKVLELIKDTIELINAVSSSDSGQFVIDGHYWSLKGYSNDLIKLFAEGKEKESYQRLNKFKNYLESIERSTNIDLGSSLIINK